MRVTLLAPWLSDCCRLLSLELTRLGALSVVFCRFTASRPALSAPRTPWRSGGGCRQSADKARELCEMQPGRKPTGGKRPF